MPRLFHGNFGFEYELRSPAKSASAAVVCHNAELAHVWIAIAEERDELVLPGDTEIEFLKELEQAGLPRPGIVERAEADNLNREFTPWGWSQCAVDAATALGIAPRYPPLDVVRRVNGRQFAAALEAEWGCGIAGTRVIHAVAEFVSAVRENWCPTARWIAKADFGMAGRERVAGRGHVPSNAALNWVTKRMQADGVVIFEPQVELVAEAGIQFDIPVKDKPTLLGVTPFLTDNAGGFRGCRFDDDADFPHEWSDAIEIGFRAAERMQSLGYFGPLGIDAAKSLGENGGVHVRPLQDINARFTMGRLSLGFRRLLPPDHAGLWLHQRWATGERDAPRDSFEQFPASLPAGVSILRTSPYQVAGRPVGHGTAVLIAEDAHRLTAILESL